MPSKIPIHTLSLLEQLPLEGGDEQLGQGVVESVCHRSLAKLHRGVVATPNRAPEQVRRSKSTIKPASAGDERVSPATATADETCFSYQPRYPFPNHLIPKTRSS